MPQIPNFRSAILPLALLTAAMIPATADASGFAVARFGGAHGNPTENNASSVYYNPAGFASFVGTQIMLDVNWALRNGSYERPASAISNDSPTELELAANTGKGEVNNFLYSPMFGITTDFGEKSPVKIGFAFFAPFGGVSDWDTVPKVEGSPGAVDGPNRWYVTEGTIRTLAFALGAAYEIKPIRLSIGVAGNLYLSEINTIRARTVTGTDDLAGEGRSLLDTKSTDFGLGAGLLWEPIENKLWVGASYQSAPNFNGKQIQEGSITNVFPPSDGTPVDVVVTTQLPDVFRWGVRGRPLEKLELRLSGDVTFWSRLKNQCVLDGKEEIDDPYKKCEVNDDGTLVNDTGGIIQNLGRDWTNAASIRLGGSYYLNAPVELQLDLSYDGSAVPDESLEPALPDFRKAGIGAGARFQITRNVAASLLVSNFFYFKRDTSDVETQEVRPSPTTQPSSAGIYKQNVFLVNTNFEFMFGDGRSARRNRAPQEVPADTGK